MIRILSWGVLCMLLSPMGALAQTNPRYLILLKDKNASPYSISKPTEFLSERSVLRRQRQNIPLTTTDLPVNPAYIEAVKQTGAKTLYASRWFNGILVEASTAQLEQITKLSFYKGIERNLPLANITKPTAGVFRIAASQNKLGTTEDLDYGRMNSQLALMETKILHDKGFHGENMLIAVLDNGFLNANKVAFLKPLFDEKRMVDTHDFLARESSVYEDGFPEHGIRVLSTMAAYLPATMVGAAYKASYALYRTENDFDETPYEEITWLMAAERADSVGADILNSSLGYRTFDGEFDTPTYNYTRAQMDGKTTIVSRAARFATRTGMLVVNAAGNEGHNGLASPADVDSVLTVGGTAYDLSPYANTSVGPNAIKQLKPDVAAVGAGTVIGNGSGNAVSGSGTSYASPLIAGLSAILWQAYPTLTAQELIKVLKKSGHLAAKPDTILGYGVPRVSVAEQIIQLEYGPLGVETGVLANLFVSPNPVEENLTLHIPSSLVGKNASLQIFQTNGSSRFEKTTRLTQHTSIPVQSLPSGLYILKVKIDQQERALKFIKR